MKSLRRYFSVLGFAFAKTVVETVVKLLREIFCGILFLLSTGLDTEEEDNRGVKIVFTTTPEVGAPSGVALIELGNLIFRLVELVVNVSHESKAGKKCALPKFLEVGVVAVVPGIIIAFFQDSWN